MIEAVRPFLHPRVVTMLFFGFSAGVPILLIFSSLSLWLREAGVERSVVTYFSWAALGYSFKFVWAPLVDSLSLPWLTAKLGRRRAWILLAQLSIIAAISLMASVDPASGDNPLVLLALAAVLLGFSSATQDIVIDAYRIESAELELQALMSATYIAGYRIGMLVAGAGALYLADWLGSSAQSYDYDAWKNTYFAMAMVMGIGVATTLIVAEPQPVGGAPSTHKPGPAPAQALGLFTACVLAFIGVYALTSLAAPAVQGYLSELFSNRALGGFIVACIRLALALALAALVARLLIRQGMVSATTVDTLYLDSVREFFQRYGLRTAITLLCLVGLYRISDIVLGVIANVFYYDLGYSKNEIATVSKVFGLLMTIAGGFLGGILAARFGVMRILLLGAVLAAATNILFMLLAHQGYSLLWLYFVISADNLSAGLASAAFVAFLSALTNIRFTAMQFAIFTSIMTLIPKVLGGYSGAMVDALGYPSFFLLTALLGVPVIVLIMYIARSRLFALTPPAAEDREVRGEPLKDA